MACLVHLVYLVGLVDLVCFVYLVDLVHLVNFVQPKKQNNYDKPNNGLRLNPIGFPCNQNGFS